MSQYKKKVKKNIEKRKENKKNEYPEKNKILNFAKTIFIVIAFIIAAIFISLVAEGKYTFKDKDTTIKYDEIIAGQTFTRSEDTYYVIFYEFDNSDITSTLNNLSSKNKIYKVNLKSAMNKDIISETGNKDVNKAEDLKVVNPTLIKIEKGSNTLYLEGETAIENYLKNL